MNQAENAKNQSILLELYSKQKSYEKNQNEFLGHEN